MKNFLLLLLFVSISCNSITEKINCVLQNEKIINEILNVIDTFKNKELVNVLIEVLDAFISIKNEIKMCLTDEPILKIGCRYELQYKACKLHSCDYLDEYECDEYCYRKYC